MCRIKMMRSTYPSMSNKAWGRQSWQDNNPLQRKTSAEQAPSITPPCCLTKSRASFHQLCHFLSIMFRGFGFSPTQAVLSWASLQPLPQPMLNYKFLLTLSFQIQKPLSALHRPETKGWLVSSCLEQGFTSQRWEKGAFMQGFPFAARPQFWNAIGNSNMIQSSNFHHC